MFMSKIQIRRGVFETNSSSTHSLQITSKKIEDVRKDIYDRIRKQYNEFFNEDFFYVDEYIQDKTFYLKGFYIEDGDETGNVYYIVNNWVAKIQYMAMYIGDIIYADIKHDNPSLSYNDYQKNSKAFITLLENNELYKWFKEEIKKYADIHHVVIDEIVWDMQYESSYVECIDCDTNDINSTAADHLGKDDFKSMFSMVMQEGYSLTYMDEAYGPFEKPKIIVL